jgi:hypothetical protein
MKQEKIEKDSYVFYRSFSKTIRKMADSEQLKAYHMLEDYALDRKFPTKLSRQLDMFFDMAQPQLDANYKRFVNGRLGGAPKGNKNAKKTTKNNQEQPKNNQKQPNENENVNENVNGGGTQPPPTIGQVVEFFKQNNLQSNPETFFSYNEAQGWPDGNWVKYANLWESRHKEKNTTKNYQPPDISDEERFRLAAEGKI